MGVRRGCVQGYVVCGVVCTAVLSSIRCPLPLCASKTDHASLAQHIYLHTLCLDAIQLFKLHTPPTTTPSCIVACILVHRRVLSLLHCLLGHPVHNAGVRGGRHHHNSHSHKWSVTPRYTFKCTALCAQHARPVLDQPPPPTHTHLEKSSGPATASSALRLLRSCWPRSAGGASGPAAPAVAVLG